MDPTPKRAAPTGACEVSSHSSGGSPSAVDRSKDYPTSGTERVFRGSAVASTSPRCSPPQLEPRTWQSFDGLSTDKLLTVAGAFADELLRRACVQLEADEREHSRLLMRANLGLVEARRWLRQVRTLEQLDQAELDFDASDYERPPSPAAPVSGPAMVAKPGGTAVSRTSDAPGGDTTTTGAAGVQS